MSTTEVLVIGGGATGVGLARDLAMRGVDVTLAERDGLGSGTTGRSHGLCHSGARYAGSHPECARDCIAESRVLRSIAGACIDHTGGLVLSLTGDDPDHHDRALAACLEADIPAEPLSAAAIRDRAPAVTEAVERAFGVPDAVVHPSRLVAATAASAREHGAVIHTHSPVETVHAEGGRVTGATIDGVGRVDAETVVNAAGPWAGRAVDDVAALSMTPTRGVMVAVETATGGPVLNRSREPSDGDIVVPRGDVAVCGTTSVPVDDPDDHATDDAEVDRVLAECAALLPAVDDASVRRSWWGVRPLFESGGRDTTRGFAVLDHDERDGIDGLFSVVGGKLTTYRLMAEVATDRVCERLGVAADCRTATTQLPAVDDPDRLDALVRTFDASSPADWETIGGA